MWTLRYKGDIQSYFTSLRALNLLAKVTGEPLQDMVNWVILSEIMYMRFAQNRAIFTEDKPFLLATYEAGRQAEMEKSLLKHIEGTTRSQGSYTNSKESGKKGNKIR